MTAEQRATPNEPRPRAVSPGRPPKATVAARLHHILSVASAEFVSRGYAEASVSRIAADAGVSKKTIYARYPNKEALLLAVTSELTTRVHEKVAATVTDPTGDPERVLTSFGTQVARTWTGAEQIALYRLMICEADRFPQLAAVYRETMARFRATLADYLRRQGELGTLTITDPDAASHQFGLLAYGDVREKALLGEAVTEQDIDDLVRQAVRMFLHGYAVPSR